MPWTRSVWAGRAEGPVATDAKIDIIVLVKLITGD